MSKINEGQKHILRLIQHDADSTGWAPVSDVLIEFLTKYMPGELAEFERLEEGGRARLTEQGNNLLVAMEWL